MNSLKRLSDTQLITVIERAKEMRLEEEFINILMKELERRFGTELGKAITI